ncbi:uncharacterized protein LOC123533782 [Mercenaria mercenaria]|uniref:uncharacterized protein LOC123533782 n=1 Tax=Mercenaria mercenaria TaxID=6596 RepID=UPI00234EB54D|nr:uncharacterized protein LOC123533782 [Mercenaria mercenaria]
MEIFQLIPIRRCADDFLKEKTQSVPLLNGELRQPNEFCTKNRLEEESNYLENISKLQDEDKHGCSRSDESSATTTGVYFGIFFYVISIAFASVVMSKLGITVVFCYDAISKVSRTVQRSMVILSLGITVLYK